MRITVAICCFNSEKVLQKTLETLRSNTPKDLNIIVVDDGSTDKTAQIATRYHAVVVSHFENMGYAQARQSALQNCDTEIIAFIDDSCLVFQDWFTTLEKLWAQVPDSTKIIAGLMENEKSESFLQKFQSRHNPFLPLPVTFSRTNGFLSKFLAYLKGKRPLRATAIGSFSNGNASMRVAALKDVGGYDSRYSIGAEDEDLANRIIEMFGESSIYFDPSLIVTHSSDGRIRSFIKRSFKYGRSAGLRYCLEGGLPTVMPIPALLISLFILGLITMGNKISIISLLILILIPILYVARSRSIKYFLLDGYLLFISEVAHLCGFFMFLVQHNKSKVFELSNS